MKVFYESMVYQMLASGIADLHCRSDYYIVDEILIEIEDKEQQKNKFINRMLAYEKALEKIRLEKE